MLHIAPLLKTMWSNVDHLIIKAIPPQLGEEK